MSDLGGVLRRRWYIAVLGLVATAGLVLLAVRLVPPTYEAKADVVLLPPRLASGAGSNPYLSLGGLDSAADVVSRALMDTDTVRAVQSRGGSRHYVVAPDRTTNGPVLLVTVSETRPDSALKTRQVVIDQLPVTLAALQTASDVDPSFQITDEVITKGDPTIVRSSQFRAVLIAVGAGLFGTILIASLVDSLIARRRRPGTPEPGSRGLRDQPAAKEVPGLAASIHPTITPAGPGRRRWRKGSHPGTDRSSQSRRKLPR